MQPRQIDPLWAQTRSLYLRHPGDQKPLHEKFCIGHLLTASKPSIQLLSPGDPHIKAMRRLQFSAAKADGPTVG